MPTTQDALTWRGSDLIGADGNKIGTIEEIYEDTETGQPEWALVQTGLFGTKRTFVPLREASGSGDSVSVPYDKAQVKDAPGIDPDGELSREEESNLYRHYGLDYSTARSDTGLPEGGSGAGGATRDVEGAGTAGGARADFERTGESRADFERTGESRADYEGAGTAGEARGDYESAGTAGRARFGRDDDAEGTVGRDVSGPTSDDAMTRSEEELQVGTRQREAGRARLRKYVVTENVETTVPVQREEVRVEREPITDANIGAATDGPAISEEEHEVVLHREEPVVAKETVPKERVRLDKDTVTDEERVSDEVRKERIEMEGDDRTS